MKLGFHIARGLLSICVTVLAGTLLTATMVRLAPGFDVDVQQLDTRLSHESREALRAQRGQHDDIVRFYATFVRNAMRGNFGHSVTLNRPVRNLVTERLPITIRLAGLGLMASWVVALGIAVSAVLLRHSAYDAVATVLGSLLLCVPAAAVAVLTVIFRVPAAVAIAVIVFPRLFRYARNVLVHSYDMPHIVTACAKGLSPVHVLMRHIVPVCAAPLIALAGVSVSMALGASVAVEALCGVPGIGQLAWQAALGRDLPLLVTLTVVVTVMTLLANTVSDVIQRGLAPATS
jgi:peptide/nickel transport system permease protein